MTTNKQTAIVESTEDERNYIDDKIVEYNAHHVPFTQKINPLPLNFVIKENDRVIAGINTCMYHWGISYIDVLWVDEAFRGKGYGSQLIKMVEEKARENACTLVHLDSFDFQAKEFYQKQGYEIFGVLENCPPGHKRFYLKKDL